MMGRDLERGAPEDGRLAARDAVPADRLHVPVVRHHVRDEHDVPDVHGEALLLERVVRLVDDRVPSGLDPQDLVNLLDRIRRGPRGVDVRELENLREVRAFRVDDVAFPSLLDDRPRDPVDAFDLHCADLLDESLEFLERGLARLDDQGPGLPLHVPDLALDLLGLAEFLEPLLELGPRDAPRLHAVVVRKREDPHVHEVRLDRRDVLEGCHLDLRRDLAHLLEVAVARLDVQLHDRGGGDAPSIDDLDESRQAEGDVHLRDAGVVKRPHGHLGPGFTDRLRGHDPGRFVRIDHVEVELLADLLEDLLEAFLAELEAVDFLRDFRHDEPRKPSANLLESVRDFLLARVERERFHRDRQGRLWFRLRRFRGRLLRADRRPRLLATWGGFHLNGGRPELLEDFLGEAVRRHLLLAEPLLPGGLLAEDLLQDVVNVNRAALDAAGRIHAVLAELELDDRVRRVPDRPVFLDFEVFEGVDQPALHVPRPRRPDGRVDEPFPTSHRVEEVLRRVEAALVRRLDESFRLRAEVALPEVRQRAVPVAAAQPLATDRLLSNRPRHLGEVQHGTAGPGPRHDHRAVLDPQMLSRDLSRLVPRASEDLHRFDLERLLEGPSRHLLKLPALVRLHEALDLLDRHLEDVRDLFLGLLGDVFIVNAGREAPDHDRADRHLRGLVDELPRGVRAVVPRELVHDLALERADRVLVDRPRGDDPVLDHDEGVFLFQFLQADVPFRRNRRFERHAQVLRKDRGEQRLPGPELLAALLDIRRREVANVDLAQDICDLLPGELALLVR